MKTESSSLTPLEEMQVPWLGPDEISISSSELRRMAASILKMSDYYISHPTAPTPWEAGSWVSEAQKYYYLPLNVMRLKMIFRELIGLGFFTAQENVIDVGAGLGATAWAMKILGLDLRHATAVERKHLQCQKMIDLPSPWTWASSMNQRVSREATWVFSYSLTEMDSLPEELKDAEKIVIVEPSTEKDARRLMAWKETLVSWGFHIWAPCVHNHPCPLLVQPHDWCHHRLAIASMPDWFEELSSYLPMQNKTLTYSYLAACRRPRLHSHSRPARVIGDLLSEKGKDRQMICSDQGRHFLSWLHRDFSESKLRGIKRSSVIDLSSFNLELKGQEFRIKS